MQLTAAIDTYGHTAGLKDGSIQAAGIEFNFVEVQPIIAAFRRMVRGLEFDVSEMAITTYMTARAYDKPLIALPIFVYRLFNHSALLINTRSGVSTPRDLEARRVGVRAYTVTQGVWSRGLLSSDYGVDLDKVTWVLVDEEHVKEFKYPPNVTIRLGSTLKDLLISGEIDAAIGAGAIDSPDIQPLFADAAGCEEDWGRRVGFSPINHLIVVQKQLLDAEPWIAQSLFDAFKTARAQSLATIAQDGPVTASDRHIQRLWAITPADPLPYGIESNRDALETIIKYGHEQHVLPRRFRPDELFAPVS